MVLICVDSSHIENNKNDKQTISTRTDADVKKWLLETSPLPSVIVVTKGDLTHCQLRPELDQCMVTSSLSAHNVDNVFFHCYHVAYKHKTNPYEVQNENQIIVPLQPGQELGAGNFLSL